MPDTKQSDDDGHCADYDPPPNAVAQFDTPNAADRAADRLAESLATAAPQNVGRMLACDENPPVAHDALAGSFGCAMVLLLAAGLALGVLMWWGGVFRGGF